MAVLFTATSVVILNNNSAVAAGTDPCIKTTDNGNIRFYPNGCGNGTPLVLVPYDDNPSKFFVDGKHAYNDTTGEEVPGLVSYYYSSGAHTVNMVREDGTTETIAVRGEDVDGGKIFDKPTDVASSGDKPVGEMSKTECDASDSAVWSGDEESGECISSTKDSCDLGALGWVICPSTQLIESMVNGIMQVITNQMEFKALTGSSTRTGMQSGWAAIRDIANIAFAIVFLIVIYSTATSTGLNNYSIKKIIPRLVIAAILVNISFWICAAMVDLSNIAGSSAKAFIDNNMVAQVNSTADPNVNPIVNSVGSFVGLIIGGTITLVGGMVVGVLFWATAVVGLVVVLATLAFRTFALVALIVISPLAFVAYLLPNTEKWFKKWLNEFTRMLLAYPAIAFVWGLTSFMIAVLSQDAGASEEGGLSFVDAILVPLVALIPAFTILPILKSSGNIMGKLTNLTQRGVDAMGGKALKNLNKKSNAALGKQLRQGSARLTQNRQEAKVDQARAVAELHKPEFDKAKNDISALDGQIFSGADSIKLNELRALGVRDANQQSEMDRLLGKKAAWESRPEDERSTVLSNRRAAKATMDKYDPEEAAKRQRRTMGYRMAYFNNTLHGKQSERERQDKARQTRALGDWLSDNSQNEKVMRSYTGLAGATADKQSDAARDAFALSRKISNSETKEKVDRYKSILADAKVDRPNGRKDVPSNKEYADLLTGKLPSIKLNVGGKDMDVPGGDNMPVELRLATLDALKDNGWSSVEVEKVAQYALLDEPDPFVRQSMISYAVQSGKAPAWLGGGAVPAAMSGAIHSGIEGAVLNFKGGVKGDPFGENVSNGQIKDVFEALSAAVNHNINSPLISVKDQDDYVASILQHLTTRLSSDTGYQLINSPDKKDTIRQGLRNIGVAETEINKWIR